MLVPWGMNTAFRLRCPTATNRSNHIAILSFRETCVRTGEADEISPEARPTGPAITRPAQAGRIVKEQNG